jgi:hypothetical protein
VKSASTEVISQSAWELILASLSHEVRKSLSRSKKDEMVEADGEALHLDWRFRLCLPISKIGKSTTVRLLRGQVHPTIYHVHYSGTFKSMEDSSYDCPVKGLWGGDQLSGMTNNTNRIR